MGKYAIMGRKFVTALALVLFARPVHAEWYRADSPHFVIYADDQERDVVRFADILERFHASMSILTGQKNTIPTPANRVTIYAVSSEEKVQKLMGDKSGSVAGFYVPRAGGSVAFVPNVQFSGEETDFSLIVLLHEYAHHFLMSSSRYALPRWVNEGGAEFFASAKFEKDGTVGIGRPAYHRAGELAFATDVTVEELLDHTMYEKRHGKKFDAFYGKAWALYHYLTFDESRKGQMKAYLYAIASGKPEREAATETFGDLKVLKKALDRYLGQPKINSFRFTSKAIPSVPVTVTKLSAGEAAIMPLHLQSRRGVTEDEAKKLVIGLRKAAAPFPNDPGVLAALAEAEFDAGNTEAAITAARSAIAADPKRTAPYVQLGNALFRKAGDAEAGRKAAAYRAAMAPFQALNKLETDHPLPLIYYYRSFTEQGEEPPELARHALERASQLAPFDDGLLFQTAIMQSREGKIGLARWNLGALAADPHGGDLAAQSQAISAALADMKEGTPWTGDPDVYLPVKADIPEPAK